MTFGERLGVRRVAGVLASVVVGAACSPAAKGGPVGLSTAGRGGSARAISADAGAMGDAGVPDYRATFTKMTSERFVSQGHAAGRFEVDVWSNDGAKGPLVDQHGTVPAGAAVVMEHWERSRDGAKRGPVMMMEKREPGYDKEHGDWRWVVVGSAGALVNEGRIESCGACHGDAPFDHLFRLGGGDAGDPAKSESPKSPAR